MSVLRSLAIAAGLLILWQAVVSLADLPAYILPGPARVGAVLLAQPGLIAANAAVTALEIVLGLVLGLLLGASAALVLTFSPVLRRWLLPVLVASQAIPVFALAPMLVLWLGYGLASKVAMATLIIFFPVTAAFHDGLRRTEPAWLDLAGIMGADRLSVLWHLRLPAALPALASGLRVAAAVAPIGAVVGEWVGSSAGLGHLMLNANARLQIDLMFAALLVLAAFALLLYALVDRVGRALTPWLREG